MFPLLRLDARPRRNDRILGDDHDSITHKIQLVVNILAVREWPDDNSIPDLDVFIEDRRFDVAIPADPDRHFRMFLGNVIIGADNDTILDYGPSAIWLRMPMIEWVISALRMREPSASSTSCSLLSSTRDPGRKRACV